MEIKIRAPHAIDATLKNLTHWFISTQVTQLKKRGKKGRAVARLKRERHTPTQKIAYSNKMSKAGGGGGSLSLQQHRQLVKLLKVNSRRDSS